MSFWSHRTHVIPEAQHRIRVFGALIVVSGAGGSAVAQEVYVQPLADVSVEADSNRDMVTTGPKESSAGYSAMAGAMVGIATPESNTTLRPLVTYYDYPQLSESAVRGTLDFASAYTGQRTQFGLYGKFDYSDLFASELPTAAFNPVNPNLPTTPETARISVNGTRTLLTVVPNYDYSLTQRLDLQVSGLYQNVSYGGNNSSDYVSYDYYSATGALDWKLTPRADLSLGVSGSRESSKDVYSVTDGRGITLTYNYNWSKVFTSSFALVGEQDYIYGMPPAVVKDTSNGVGATYVTSWKGQISQVQLTLGRTFTPNGAGGKFSSDAIQVEYKRQITPRTLFDTAVHYIQNVALSNRYADGNYDYLVVSADLRWMITPTWYVAGGLQYLEEKSPEQGLSANNSMAQVSFGYRGLDRQN
jgi:hypothetical protein